MSAYFPDAIGFLGSYRIVMDRKIVLDRHRDESWRANLQPILGRMVVGMCVCSYNKGYL